MVRWGGPAGPWPRKTNMEPENTPLEKEKHLQTTIFGVPAVSFWGCKTTTQKENRRKITCSRHSVSIGVLKNKQQIFHQPTLTIHIDIATKKSFYVFLTPPQHEKKTLELLHLPQTKPTKKISQKSHLKIIHQKKIHPRNLTCILRLIWCLANMCCCYVLECFPFPST